MGELLGRRAIVTVGAPGEGAAVFDSGRPPARGFRIAFGSRKSLKSSLNSGDATIWNLSETSRARILRDRTRFQIEAGYKDDVAVLFRGQVTRSRTSRQGADFVTSIESLDGYDAVAESEVFNPRSEFQTTGPVRGTYVTVHDAYTIPVGTTIRDAVEGVASFLTAKNDVVLGDLDAAFVDIEVDARARGQPLRLMRGLALEGKAAEILDRFGRQYRFDWSIQDGVFVVHSWDHVWMRDMVDVKPGTGLIGASEPIFRSTQDGGETGVVIGCRFRSFLRPAIKPGVLVAVESELGISGRFRVHEATYSGDTVEGSFTVEAETYRLPGMEPA